MYMSALLGLRRKLIDGLIFIAANINCRYTLHYFMWNI